MKGFEINFLDHVAIRVRDMEASAAWYNKVLGLKIVKIPEWGDFPVFLFAGQSGIALFPANEEDSPIDPKSRNVKIDHYAFNVSRENFEKAQDHLDSLSIEYEIKDHTHFHSLYMKDPDNHTVELTTLISDPDQVY